MTAPTTPEPGPDEIVPDPRRPAEPTPDEGDDTDDTES
jgi:hypothetical protein